MTKAKKKKEKKLKLDMGGDAGGTQFPSAHHGLAPALSIGAARKHAQDAKQTTLHSGDSSTSGGSEW